MAHSCLKESECTVNVFEDEELAMNVNIDGLEKSSSDTAENQIYVGFKYQIDATRTDTVYFHYNTHYLFDDGSVMTVTMVKYADFSEVFDHGGGVLTYARFDSLYHEGEFEFVARTDLAPPHGIDIKYVIGDTLEYVIDASQRDPDDFMFYADNFIQNTETDCYGRKFTWFSYHGSFNCRLVNPSRQDTIYVTDGDLRAIAAQFYYVGY